jgi:hypothetical protein
VIEQLLRTVYIAAMKDLVWDKEKSGVEES